MAKVKSWCCEQHVQELIVWPSDQSVSSYELNGFKSENEIMEIEWY